MKSEGNQSSSHELTSLSKALRLSGDFDAAEETVNQALLGYPNANKLLAELAEIATARKDWPEAVTRWQAFLEAAGEKPPRRAFRGLASALRRQGDIDGAAAVIHRGMAHYPEASEFSAELAEIAMARKDWPEAVTRWQAVLEVRGKKPPRRAFRGLASALRRQGDIDGVAAVIQQGLAHYPEASEFSAELAKIATAREDWPEAVKRWQAVLEAAGVEVAVTRVSRPGGGTSPSRRC